jgi:hypothetical protein
LFLGHKKERKTVKNFPIIRHFLSWYARCLESGVQRTEDSTLLLLLSGSEYVLRFLVLLLALAVTSVFGQESVVTLAMVSYDQSPARTSAVARNHSAANLLCYDASAPRLQYRVAALKLDNQNATDFSSDFRLEKQNGSNQRDLFQLIHKKLSADGRTGKWVDVTAGYGQVCQFESGIGKNTAELQRPGFAYLRASFSF